MLEALGFQKHSRVCCHFRLKYFLGPRKCAKRRPKGLPEHLITLLREALMTLRGIQSNSCSAKTSGGGGDTPQVFSMLFFSMHLFEELWALVARQRRDPLTLEA